MIAISAIILVAVYIIWKGEREGIRDIILIIGGIAVFWRAASHDKIAKATLQSNEQTIFKDSIESLAHPSESVRLGGIYSLYELAIQDPKRSKEVLEILCAHLRSKTKEDDYIKNHKVRPSEEISSLLKLLTSKESKLRMAYEESSGEKYMLNLQGAFLNGAYCADAWLRGANLSEACMQSAWLANAQMQGAFLTRAHMHGAWLDKAQMQGAFLLGAQMQGASLFNVQMQGAILLGTKLHGANLEAACLQVAELHNTELQGAVLEHVQLQGADLQGVILRGASGRPPKVSLKPVEFIDRVKVRQGKGTDLGRKVIFSGGLSQKNKKSIAQILEQAEQYARFEIPAQLKRRRNALNNLDVDTDPSHEIPKGKKEGEKKGVIEEVVIGILDEKEADQIIAEYNKATAWKKKDADDSD